MGSHTPKTSAMLYAITTPSSKIPEDEWNKWYDEEHAPSRLNCPGVLSAARFVSVDGYSPAWMQKGSQRPCWTALYELEDLSALQTPEYQKLRETAGDEERKMFDSLDRRLYKIYSEKTSDRYEENKKSGTRVYSHIALQPDTKTDLTDDEFHRFYEEEHVPLLQKCPQWLRSTRWELVDVKGAGLSEIDASKVPKFFAIHEWTEPTVNESAEMKHAISTPWRNRVMGSVDMEAEERRMFKLWKQF